MRNDNWVKIGSTEQIDNDLNPNFKTSITVDYKFEKLQKLKFQLIDGDLGGKYDFIGELETTLGALMGARNQLFMDRLSRNGSEKKNGVLIVRVEAVAESNMAAKFQLKWTNVNNTTRGCFGMCQGKRLYRFTIQRLVPGTKNQFIMCQKSHLHFEEEVTEPKL